MSLIMTASVFAEDLEPSWSISEGLQVVFVRDMDHPNRYIPELRSLAHARVPISGNRIKQASATIKGQMSARVSLLAVPEPVTDLYLEGLPEGIQTFPIPKDASVIPFFVRDEANGKERLMLLGRTKYKSVLGFYFLSPENYAEAKRVALSGSWSDKKAEALIEKAGGATGLKAPSQKQALKVHLESQKDTARKIQQRRRELGPEINEHLQNIAKPNLPDENLERLHSILEYGYPVGHFLVSKSDLLPVADQYDLDFEILEKMQERSLLRYAKIAEKRLAKLFGMIDASDATKIDHQMVLKFLAATESESPLFKSLLELHSSQRIYTRQAPQDYFNELYAIASSGDALARELIVEKFLTLPELVEYEKVRELYRKLISEPSKKMDSKKYASARFVAVSHLMDFVAQFDDPPTEALLKFLLDSDDPAIQEALRVARVQYDSAVRGLAGRQVQGPQVTRQRQDCKASLEALFGKLGTQAE